jgi:hypothetical protein
MGVNFLTKMPTLKKDGYDMTNGELAVNMQAVLRKSGGDQCLSSSIG